MFALLSPIWVTFQITQSSSFFQQVHVTENEAKKRERSIILKSSFSIFPHRPSSHGLRPLLLAFPSPIALFAVQAGRLAGHPGRHQSQSQGGEQSQKQQGEEEQAEEQRG